MSGSQSPDVPTIINGVLGTGMLILGGVVGHLIKLIWRSDATTLRIAAEIKADLVRANEAHADAMEALNHRFETRWSEAISERMNSRIENKDNHKQNSERLDRLLERLSELPTKSDLSEMRRRSTDVNA